MGSVQQIKVKWNHHNSNFAKVFDNLLHKKEFVDVTLACEGQSLKAHKMVLSACSPYFHTLFIENPNKHPIVIMKDYKYCDIEAVIEYMYKGEVNISRDSLREFLRTAQSLQVKGLADDDPGDTDNDGVETEDRSYTVPQSRVSEPEPEIRPSSRLSRLEHTSVSHSQNQILPSVSRESLNVKRESFINPPSPKRMKVHKKPAPLPPTPVALNKPSVSYQPPPSPIPQTNSVESTSEVIETPIKIEMKPFDVVGFEATQDSMLDESQDNDQGVEDSEPDMIDLGDDPEIIEDEQESMFTHGNSSQDGMLSQGDEITSNLLSAIRDASAGSSAPQSSSESCGSRRPGWNTSLVWQYYGQVNSSDSKMICLVCGTPVAVGRYNTPNGSCRWSTSNLLRHLHLKHNHLYKRIKGT